MLAASEQDWSQRAAVSWTGSYPSQQIANDNRVDEERKILDDGSTSRSHTTYDQFNNPTRVDEYDFDGSLKRFTTTSYVTGSPYWGSGVNSRNMVRMPLQQSVFDGPSALELARTTYEYDNYAGDGNNQPLTTYSDFFSIPGHTSSYDTSFIVRGNATKMTRRVSSTVSLDSYTRYDVLGNVVSVKDPKGNVAAIDYLDDFGNGGNPGFNTGGHSTYSLPTKLTSPPPNPSEPAHIARAQYDFSTGVLTGFKDRNGIITQTVYNDPFDRPTQIKVALGTPVENHTAMYYAPAFVFGVNLTNNDVLTAKDQTSIDDGTLRSWTHTDGFGRTIDGFTRDPQGDVRATTTYDGLGRTKRVTNPYRSTSDPAFGYTQTTFDMLGRAIRVETFNGSDVSTGAVTTAYSGSQVTGTDQAGKVRRSVSDGLGRLKQVIEDPNSLAYSTTYGYDALDDLTSVTQGAQTRTFVYDGLKRLTQAINPESLTINYSYDANSNLQTKQDARVITTTYAYDALNRLTSRAYTNDPRNTPAVSYKYDGQSLPSGAPSFARGASIGRLVAVTYGGTSAGSYTGYDQLGRVNVSVQQTESQNYGLSYVYNLASEMTSETYPSGRVITTGFDTAGRINAVNGQKTGEPNKTYASQFSYAAHGAVASMTFGNSLVEKTEFNTRLQPTFIKLGTTSNPTSVLQLGYEYTSTCQSANNGNVLKQTISAPGLSLTQNYCYDVLNRLSSANENNGSSWTQTYDYDRYGNRAVRNTSYMPQPQLTPQSAFAGDMSAFNASNNRLVASLYDAAGNQTADAQNRTFSYDAENRQVTFNGTAAQYFYDGDGHRVKKIDGTGTTVFVYNAGGQLIAEYHSDPVPPAAGGGGTSYLTSDHLGSTRVVSKQDGTVKARYDYLPFGEELPSGIGARTVGMGYSAADSTKQKFTQKERDNESGLDYFGARYYSGPQGRFTSVDPLLASGRVEDGQSWNRYTYAFNNPLRYIDPLGLWNWDTSAGGSSTDDELRKRQKNKSLRKDERKAAERALKFREKFRDALATAAQAGISGSLSHEQQTRVQESAAAYGSENDNNNVIVGFRPNSKSNDATTLVNTDDTITVTFDEGLKDNKLVVVLAHEGRHVTDGMAWLSTHAVGGATDLNHWSREWNGWFVSSYTAQALGMKNYGAGGEGGKYEVWNRGWKEVDRSINRLGGVARILDYSSLKRTDTDTYSKEHKH